MKAFPSLINLEPGLPKHSFSHVTMNFAMHIIPDPGAVLRGKPSC